MDVDLQACTRGDKRAWDAFVDRWSGLIHSAVRRTMAGRIGPRAEEEMDDTVQEVYVRLVRNDYRLLGSYDPARASLSTWLTIVARSVAIDQLRRRRPDPVPLDAELLPAEPDRRAAEPDLSPPLQVLTARQRLVLRMLFDEEMSVEEAAVVIGVSEQTIRSTKHKALSRLRDEMARERAEEGAG